MAAGEEGPSHVLRITLLGDITADADGRPVALPSRKSRALLAYLALSPNMRVSRERVCGVLWPDSPTELAQGSLRHEIWTIRAAMNRACCPVLLATRTDLQLEAACVRVDVNELIDDWLGHGKIGPDLLTRSRIADDLCYGYEDLLSDWLIVMRQKMHNELLHRLEQLLVERTESEADAREVCRAILNLDPTHEVACRHLMRGLARVGNRAGALQVYSRLWHDLDEEHGEEPSARTQAVYLQIKTENPDLVGLGATSPQGSEPEPVTELSRPAVEPGNADGAFVTIYLPQAEFNDIGANERRLVGGLRMDLLACLVRFREWRISAADPPEPAVPGSYALRMNASRVGQDLGLTMTLCEVGTEFVVWADSLNISVAGWGATQREIVRRLSMALNVYISADRLSRVQQRQDFELETYDRWLRGQELFLSYQSANWARAEELFRSIAAEAPSFSRAYSSLAQIENSRHLAFPGMRRSRLTMERALEYSERAVTLDPMDSRAQLCRAWSLTMAGRYESAEPAYETACELNRSDPWTLISAALGMSFVERTDRARELVRAARSAGLVRKPIHAGYVATLNFLCGDYEGCVGAVDEAGGAIHNLPGWKAAALGLLGETAAARRVAQEFVERTGSNWHGDEEPTPSAVADWFLHCFPIRDAAKWDALRMGLAEAGLETSFTGPRRVDPAQASHPH